MKTNNHRAETYGWTTVNTQHWRNMRAFFGGQQPRQDRLDKVKNFIITQHTNRNLSDIVKALNIDLHYNISRQKDGSYRFDLDHDYRLVFDVSSENEHVIVASVFKSLHTDPGVNDPQYSSATKIPISRCNKILSSNNMIIGGTQGKKSKSKNRTFLA
jgi:mRNA-degrading endonuclease RelE of RelBE toxin-antitoxin system